MGIVEEDRFRLSQELRKVCPTMRVARVWLVYRLTARSKERIMPLFQNSKLDPDEFQDVLENELDAEDSDHYHDGPDTEQNIKFYVENPEVFPDSIEIQVPINKQGAERSVVAELELAKYSIEFVDEDGIGGYRVNELDIQKDLTDGGRCLIKRYAKLAVCGETRNIGNPVKVHILQNMLRAKFDVASFDSYQVYQSG